MSDIERCPTCGSAVRLEGHITRYYMPVESEQLDRWRKVYNTISRSHYEEKIARLEQQNAAHDAETAAKALEEVTRDVGYMRGTHEGVRLLDFLEVKAAEYRAKAGRKE